MSELIDREAAINALWKALYEYEDKTEKQFQESGELDLRDWILHRIFVQNMSDIDRKVIQDLPAAPCWERMREELTELHENNMDKPDVEGITRFLLNWMKVVEKE